MSQVTVEELDEINSLKTQLVTVVNEVGQATLRLEILKADVEELTTKISQKSVEFKGLLAEEEALIKRLSDKYGAGSINFETGEFTPEN